MTPLSLTMKPKIPLSYRTLRHALILISAAFLTSCASPDFRDSWRQATSTPTPNDITGAWEGTWKSEQTGHTGNLRCLVTRDTKSPSDHSFHYWASWKHLVSGEFTVNYPVNQRGGKSSFGGRHNLGKALGGTFSHNAVATPTTYDATYSAAKDQGTFTLVRP